MEKRQETNETKQKVRKIKTEEDPQYYGLTKQEIEWRKKMAAKFGRKPTHLDPNTIEESKDVPSQPNSSANFLNRKSGMEKPKDEGTIGRISSYKPELS